MKKNKNTSLIEDSYEKELSSELDKLVDSHKLNSSSNLASEVKVAMQAASNYFRKDSRVNIRISSNDLDKLKQKAAYNGLPYQTYIASLLHKHAAGHM